MVVTLYDQLAIAAVIIENQSSFTTTAINAAKALIEAAIVETPSEPETGP